MKLRKSVAKGLALGIIISNLPLYSFANETNLEENKYTQELSNIETKEDLQKSAQIAVSTGEVDTWITGLANMSDSRALFTSVVVDRKIYVIGGSTSHYVNTVEVYDPVSDSWETKTTMPTYRYGLTSAVVDGKIYCIGGYSGGYSTNKVEVYDPVTDTWETKTSMPTKRESLTSSVIDGKIYVIGGYDYNSSDKYLNKVEVYDPKTDTWETKNPMPTARSGLTSAVVDGKIYCIGGSGSSFYYNTVEVYDPATDSWETKNPMPTARSHFTSAVVDGKIYCIGGYNGSYLNKVEVYDSKTDKWEAKTAMPTKRAQLTSNVIGGKIYAIGGCNANSTYFNKLEVYIAVKASPEQEVKDAVDEAEQTKDPIDIEDARDLVNQLEESELKNNLQDRLNAIVPNLSLTPQSVTSNLDIYIKSENMLSLSLDTNSVTFEDFSGVEEIEKSNALTISINSSLAYDLNAYLVGEIQNADGSKKIDIDRLNIKDNTDVDYKEFAGVNQKLTLKDNCNAGNDLTHNIDLKLKGGNAYEADIYKTVIKFEAEQK